MSLENLKKQKIKAANFENGNKTDELFLKAIITSQHICKFCGHS